ncbi:TPA: hypothetical protein QDZ42_002088 [Stenotrophomonas maltophilia]|nr:hypothetical protein [Stenotrophomonas maltophilia]HDS1043433.1 hypothetical protein [Stenotrophomonas maltophilia]
MNYAFTAHCVAVEDCDGTMVISLADHAETPTHWLILQRARHYDAQDARLGMDCVHLQTGHATAACYGGIRSMALCGDQLQLSLSAQAQAVLGFSGAIEVALADADNHCRLKAALADICKAESIPLHQHPPSDRAPA